MRSPSVSTSPALVRWLSVADVDPAWHGLLDAGERGRYEVKGSDAERARFLGAAVLMREVAAELAGCDRADVGLHRACPDCAEPHGRPVPTGAAAGWHVSASHSGLHVLVAGAGRPVGVDVEVVRAAPPSPRLLERVLAPQERAPTEPEEFAHLWAAKEAYLKAIGTGLALSMSRVVVDAGEVGLRDETHPAGRLTRLDAPDGVVGWLCVL
ncbi:4'-phosphopantetheinyl transferase superfamily protein [Janibacter sp. YIM B02568]|uniref:4'-phosphopantetheinyl transferase family protein n=1 Tax=Janibacter endophyticus TaxID=2806261 RepID=UPI001951C387|nr:4'-phosphopantetheinyl transferase superfamily protein [Janibacter endophyticus]MBM6545658.1 4'-phosphopantetheinyl transferase superfamily protein [Janibacter endophyticus]